MEEQQLPPEDAFYNSIIESTFVEESDDGYLFTFGLEGATAKIDKREFDETPSGKVNLLIERPFGDHWQASATKVRDLELWDKIEALQKSGETVSGEILSLNRGGLSVDVLGLRGFVPKSQVDTFRVEDFTPYIGKTADFKITKFDAEKCDIVLSRRALLEADQKANRSELLDAIAPGQVYSGVVRNLTKFGAFVDIGGVEGLLHLSNMSWGRIDHPSEAVRSGEVIDVVVLDYDREKNRLGLGRKQIIDDPWDTIGDRFKVGDKFTGKITSLADFGAFVQLEPGLEGLVHITELSWTERVKHPSDVLKSGEEIDVQVIGLDNDSRRISLSTKALQPNPYASLLSDVPVGSTMTGEITSITDFGLFVRVTEHLDGLVHHSDISWTESSNKFGEKFSVGDSIETKVLDIDVETGRIALGIKQLSNDPWADAAEIAKVGERIKVTISRIEEFGAFATIIDGIDGLIHVSELATDRVDSVRSVVKPGDEIEVLVLAFDRGNERISLSKKRETLDDVELKEYQTEGDSTSTLGDLLREQLGIADESE